MHQRNKSHSIYESLCEVIPGGVNFPIRACKGVNHQPMIVESGCKDQIFDVDGNSYIDYCGSWGALIHGHAHPNILEAVYKRAAKGTSFGIATEIEGQLARKIIECMDSIEKVRFVSSGTEATMSAVRLARGFTGRKTVIKFNGHYHGHADFFLVQAGSGLAGLSPTSSSAGIPEDVVKHMISLPFNDIEAARSVFQDSRYQDDIAAVILEPIAGNMGVVAADPLFVQMLREETHKAGALLIFDEVITGFRVALKGACSLYNVKPDLTTLGKIIGGGFPLAAFGGRKDVMDYLAPLGPVYQAGTLSGNPVAVEAGLQALTLLQEEGFYQKLEEKTKNLIDPIKKKIKQKNIAACIQDVGSMFTIFFGRDTVSNMEEAKTLDLTTFARFFGYMFARGVYIPPLQFEPWFVSMAHDDAHIGKTQDIILQFFDQ